MSKPTCKVHGMIAPNAICGQVIVGMKYCGFTGDCEHKSVSEMLVNLVKEVPVAQPSTNQEVSNER